MPSSRSSNTHRGRSPARGALSVRTVVRPTLLRARSLKHMSQGFALAAAAFRDSGPDGLARAPASYRFAAGRIGLGPSPRTTLEQAFQRLLACRSRESIAPACGCP